MNQSRKSECNYLCRDVLKRYKEGRLGIAEHTELLIHASGCEECYAALANMDIQIVQERIEYRLEEALKLFIHQKEFCPCAEALEQFGVYYFSEEDFLDDYYLHAFVNYHTLLCPGCRAISEFILEEADDDWTKIDKRFEGVEKYSEEWYKILFGSSYESIKEKFGLLATDSLSEFFYQRFVQTEEDDFEKETKKKEKYH